MVCASIVVCSGGRAQQSRPDRWASRAWCDDPFRHWRFRRQTSRRRRAGALDAGPAWLSRGQHGQHGQAIRVNRNQVPLTASDALLDEGLALFEQAPTPAPVDLPAGAVAEDVAA